VTSGPWPLHGAPGRRRALVAALLLALSLPAAGALVLERAATEGRSRTVAIVMDELALAEQAALLGRSPLELALHYQSLGLAGIAVYEETIETLARTGAVVALLGREARAAALLSGQPLPDVPGDATLVSEVIPGAAAALLAKNRPPASEIEFGGRTWWWWPGESLRTRPAGPDTARVAAWAAAGFDVAYRPRNFPNLQGVGSDFPAEARYLIHAGLQVAGHPHALDDTAAASQDRLTALIEGTPQDGLRDLARQVPTVRLLSFNQDYQNLRLRPDELVEKYLLAANEREVRLLYLRPYTEEQLGDMLANTEALVSGLRAALERDGFAVARLAPPDAGYAPAGWLRAAAGVGVVAGLALLATALPSGWGALAAAGVLGVALLAAGPAWAALALIAALVFPVLGFALLPWRWWALPAATGISLVGAGLLAAVGSDRASMLALEPFAGVGATLVVPPALLVAVILLRQRPAAAWVRTLWTHRPRLGEVALGLAVVAALGLVVMRRGNFPLIGASEIELALRSALNEWFVRPRFKELLGHPLALLALLQVRWPWWARGGLLVAGVVAQASVLNSFSHYHTPLLVSLQRSMIALAIGVVVGLALVAAARLTERTGRRWLGADPT
jgi:hypothetical protein